MHGLYVCVLPSLCLFTEMSLEPNSSLPPHHRHVCISREDISDGWSPLLGAFARDPPSSPLQKKSGGEGLEELEGEGANAYTGQ